ncbi:chromosomal replication initiator protein DnaA [Patescibacteria group bacterium]|nr:chromosomal replication initiator protein DnaA [Patescibacteria group bacterium]
MDAQALWQAALGELELSLPKSHFMTWFKHTFIGSIEEGRVCVCVPNDYTKTWLQSKYHDMILKVLRDASQGGVREVTYRKEAKNAVVMEALAHVPVPTASEAIRSQQEPLSTNLRTPTAADTCVGAAEIGLNPRYQFDSFVVGKNNELAHAASVAVAGRPGETYNPLFIYGGAGMGKTHLLQAIGHHILRERAHAKVRYVTSERFTNEFIAAVRSGHGNDFKDAYRTVDVLLIDDIQFLTGKESTQEEFFHTFNALHQSNKQIVIASDRPPKELQTLENRLISRFEWGMMADISRPDFETRVAILDNKVRERNYVIGTDLLHIIAGAVQSNIRELEGILNKVIAYHQFKNIQPSIQTLEPILQGFLPQSAKRTLTPRILIEVITKYYDVPLDDLLGKSRERRFALPRQIAMYLLREELKCSFPAIGDHLGSRDHTTAMHACEKVTGLAQNDEQTKQDLARLREHLYNHQVTS